jgi:hypothetical protein
MYTVYEVCSTVDGKRDKVFYDKDVADVYAMHQNDVEVKPITVLEHLEDGPEYVREQNRVNALKKLTVGELEALGLS